ncbi:MAG TPA: hypothetical protein VF230_12730 [Acidimicrobiales bacterium]
MSPAAKKAAGTKKRGMTDAHKAALAAGREQGRAVRAYLEALETHRPKRGRKRTVESIKRQLAAVEQRLSGADPLGKVQLIQQRMDLQRELEGFGTGVDLSALEARFVEHAAAYSTSKGITYSAWRQAGVDAGVLRKAGISR